MAFQTTKALITRRILILTSVCGTAPLILGVMPVQARYAMQMPAVDSRPKEITDLEAHLLQEGLVNVLTLDPTLMVDLKYAKAANFMGEAVYGDFDCAYLRPEAARKLAKANQILRARHPELRLLVADALRPRRIQAKMWAYVVNTPQQRYVANPATGSMHNFGAAVDVTLYHVEAKKRLDMGTPMDHFGPLSQPALEAVHHKAGLLTDPQLTHRVILREVMCDAGWHPLAIEWWHFDAFPKKYVRQTYAIIE